MHATMVSLRELQKEKSSLHSRFDIAKEARGARSALNLSPAQPQFILSDEKTGSDHQAIQA
jgi:hypothetical protein